MDRAAMYTHLEEWLESGYGHFQDSSRQAFRRGTLKTYLVEANTGSDDEFESQGGIPGFLASLRVSDPIDIKPTEDPTLFQIALGTNRVEFFLDCFDRRFWILHSTASAGDADNAISKLVRKTRRLDSFWLPSWEFESWIGQLGIPRIMTAKFAINTGIYQGIIDDEAFEDNGLLFKIGSTSDVSERWRLFRDGNPALASKQALWGARVVRSDDERRSINDITSSGKITVRGNSFAVHTSVVLDLVERYRTLITGWESRYQQHWEVSKGGIVPSGNVAEFRWPEPLDVGALSALLSQMFSGGEPFRLYGIPVSKGGGRFSVRGVDLHTGGQIDFEVRDIGMWMHLPADGCGNAIARLLTNLQHFHDARTALYGF